MQEISYSEYKDYLQKIADVKYASAVLEWDRETYLPKNGHAARGRQIATLSEISHEQFTNDKFGELLDRLHESGELSALERNNVSVSREDYRKNKKLTPAFVRRMSEAVNKSFYAWVTAKRENNFAHFQRPLQDIIDLKKQEADMLGFEGHPYDALLNDYDKGLTTLKVDTLFADLRPELQTLISDISGRPQPPDDFLHQYFDKDTQWKAGLEILKQIHFDFDAGRQDISEHPFTTGFSSEDVRITTRIDEHDFGSMLWSCIHEGGHALYEQGLPVSEYGLPSGEFCSLSIHESQSRLWENCIGRSKPFWEKHLPVLQQYFSAQLGRISAGQFFRAINKVQPSLIRTEADELTYHFHVMIRYELEKMLIEGMINAADIPSAWNELYKKYLDINVPDDTRGCLQDVHWSHGSFGYFATYSIGSLYAAQFYSAMQEREPHLATGLSGGSTKPVKDWLQKNIYNEGRQLTSEQLCVKATGEPLNSRYFLEYARRKFASIYESINNG